MQRLNRWFLAFTLVGALTAPVIVKAGPQERREEQKERHERAENRRVYDTYRRDYHNWDATEDARYRAWLAERHRQWEYRDYDRLNKKNQREYWRWRHEQEERREGRR